MSERSRHDLDYSTRGTVADIAVSFAGVLLMVVGSFDVLQGVAAIANDDLFASTDEYIYKIDLTAWGVVHVLIGAASIAIGFGVLRGATWGRIAGIVVAGLAVLSNFAYLPLYPWWAVTMILINLLVIWAFSVQLRNYR